MLISAEHDSWRASLPTDQSLAKSMQLPSRLVQFLQTLDLQFLVLCIIINFLMSSLKKIL